MHLSCPPTADEQNVNMSLIYKDIDYKLGMWAIKSRSTWSLVSHGKAVHSKACHKSERC